MIGVAVDGRDIAGDLVVDASGRGHLSVPLRGKPAGGSCGLSYIESALPAPGQHRAWTEQHADRVDAIFRDGYQQIVFRHDNGYFNVLLVRATADKDLAELRHEHLWNAAIGLFPAAGAWFDPDRAEPAGPVRAGGGLTNTYLGQAVGLTGLLAIGDAVATTNPTGGRGVSLGISSAVAMTRIVETRRGSAGRPNWTPGVRRICAAGSPIRSRWMRRHLRRWTGLAFDPAAPLPIDVVHAALSSDPDVRRGADAVQHARRNFGLVRPPPRPRSRDRGRRLATRRKPRRPHPCVPPPTCQILRSLQFAGSLTVGTGRGQSKCSESVRSRLISKKYG